MTHKSISIFAQIIKTIFTRNDFQRIVNTHQGDKHAKGLTCWDQWIAMSFLHLSQLTSLREIVGGLRCTIGKIKHLGMQSVPKKSTLSYANAHRPWKLYQELFYTVLARCRSTLQTGNAFRFKNKLLSMDATFIQLCLELFPWATYRQTKGAVKVHLLLDHEGYFPVFAHITNGKTADAHVAHLALTNPGLLPAGSIVVFDRGYVDFHLFEMLCARGVYFVTRLKAGMNWKVVRYGEVPKHRHILRDDEIQFCSKSAKNLGQQKFRIVESLDPETGESIIILTNHLAFGATTIARIYKDRWQIEIFFKTIKQHLKIKTFVGTTENALLIQIWTALITILILKYLKALSSAGISLSNSITYLRLNLFSYRDLMEWLSNPYLIPLQEPSTQMEMNYG